MTSERANKFLWNIHTSIEKSRIPGSDEDKRFLALALCGEAGEVANLIKKKWRGDDVPDFDAKLREELGDVYAYMILFGMSFGIEIKSNEIYGGSPVSGDEGLYFLCSSLCSKLGKVVDSLLMPWAADEGASLTVELRNRTVVANLVLCTLAKHCNIDLDEVLHNEILPKIQARWGHLVG
jgi:NTP pyrophosphatase (non-canonical NTP hydrolase)